MAGFLDALQQQLRGGGVAERIASTMPVGPQSASAAAPLPSLAGTAVADPNDQGAGFVQALQAMLAKPNAPAVATPAVATAGGPVAAPPQAKPQSGITAADVQSFVRNVMGGAAAVDPRKPIATAVAQGAAGAMFGQEADRRHAEKAASDAEEKKFERGLKTSAEGRAAAKERREARHESINNSKIEAEIKKLNAEAIKALNPDLTVDQRINIERLARDGMNHLYKLKENGDITEEEFKTQGGQLRDDLMKRIKPDASAAPQSGQQRQPREGDTAINPKTKARIIYKGGQWVPL